MLSLIISISNVHPISHFTSTYHPSPLTPTSTHSLSLPSPHIFGSSFHLPTHHFLPFHSVLNPAGVDSSHLRSEFGGTTAIVVLIKDSCIYCVSIPSPCCPFSLHFYG